MKDFVPETPYNRRTWAEMLDSKPTVPNTEDRKLIRIPSPVHSALVQVRHLSNRDSLTDIASLGLYYSKDAIRRTYDIDWDGFEAWYMEQLEQTATWDSWGNELQSMTFGYQESLDKVIAVRPKSKNLHWIERLGYFCHLHEQDDVLRLLLYYALTMYNWNTFAGEQWERWLETPRRAVWEFEQVVKDRKARMTDEH